MLGGSDFFVGFTLPPLNPVEQPSYSRWKRLTQELSLTAVFETGSAGGLKFTENLSAANLFLTTSVAEGFGMVFLEAAACGKPAIGGRSGGAGEAIVHGRTGLLVNSTRAGTLERAIVDLLDDPARARAMGCEGRKRVEAQFDWPQVSQAIQASLLSANGRVTRRPD